MNAHIQILLKTAFKGCCMSNRASDCVLFENFHAFMKQCFDLHMFVPECNGKGCAGWALMDNGIRMLQGVKAGVECACVDDEIHVRSPHPSPPSSPLRGDGGGEEEEEE